MDDVVRKFFRSERKRLDLTQEQVAATAGIRQGMVSQIERIPSYQPGVRIFEKALRGIGHTLSSFDERIALLRRELPVKDGTPHAHRQVDSDDPATSSERRLARLGRVNQELNEKLQVALQANHDLAEIITVARREREEAEAAAENHRHATGPAAGAPTRTRHDRKHPPGTPKPKTPRRSARKGR